MKFEDNDQEKMLSSLSASEPVMKSFNKDDAQLILKMFIQLVLLGFLGINLYLSITLNHTLVGCLLRSQLNNTWNILDTGRIFGIAYVYSLAVNSD